MADNKKEKVTGFQMTIGEKTGREHIIKRGTLTALAKEARTFKKYGFAVGLLTKVTEVEEAVTEEEHATFEKEIENLDLGFRH